MLGLKRGFFPTVLIAMRKNLLPYLSVSEPQSSVFKCLTKRDKVWVNELMLIMLKTMLLSQRLWISVFQCTRLGSLFEKKKKQRKGANLASIFCTYLFIVIYYDSSAETLFFVRPNPGWGQKLTVHFSSKSYKQLLCA